MATLATSAEWDFHWRTPDQLPYGMHAHCFRPCPPTPEDQVHWWPSCLCTYVAPPVAPHP
jgi:hypothetical protein